jgi:HK97 gp10 family phage protein
VAEDFNHFPQISDELHTALALAVKAVAFQLQAAIQSNAPVDTGFLRNSVYVVTIDSSSYGQGGGPTAKDTYLLPPVGVPDDDMSAWVGVGANYGIYLEFGTRFMPAQPYFMLAVRATEHFFDSLVQQIVMALS